MLVDDYRDAVRKIGLLGVAFVALALAALWFAIATDEPQVLLLAGYFSLAVLGGVFAIVSVYYLVLGFLSGRPGARTSPPAPRKRRAG